MAGIRYSALLVLALAACSAATGRFDPPLRVKGGEEVAATAAQFGRAQAPLKSKGAFKIARVLSQGFEQLLPSLETSDNIKSKYGSFAKKLEKIGWKDYDDATTENDPFLSAYVNLKLAACGASPVKTSAKEESFMRLIEPILKTHQEQNQVLHKMGMELCPVDQRIQNFINSYLDGVDGPVPQLPARQLKMDRHGLSKLLSLPKNGDKYQSEIMTSFRCSQGITHNPKSDKRTTKGSFHVVDGGLPASLDKKLVPKVTFKRMLERAFKPPTDLNTLPYTINEENPTEIMCSLYMRPLARPEVQGFTHEKTNEIRYFVPGGSTSNLDFVESIFGNGDNPDLAENDAALDPEGWTGVTGCVILATHLLGVNAKEMGLPHKVDATERQIRDGMYWENPDDKYNQGGAFKLTCRDARGVVITIIADNYFGYCKKECKTQLGYAANLQGMQEEEHAGGCIAYPAFDLGEEFDASLLRGKSGPGAFLGATHQYLSTTEKQNTFKDVMKLLGDTVQQKPEGYAVDLQYPDIYYVPEDAKFSMTKQTVEFGGKSINLKPRVTYMLPTGYKVEMVKKGSNVVATKSNSQVGQYERWHLKGSVAEGSNLHKPATVSGGGKSEISKRLQDMITTGPVFCADIDSDFDKVDEIFGKDYTNIVADKKHKHPFEESGVKVASIKTLLDPMISTGIIIKLLSPMPHYTEEHNKFVAAIPDHIRELVSVIKQNYKPEWGNNWRINFHTDAINGHLGHELKLGHNPLLSSCIRVGFRSPHDQDIPLPEGTQGGHHASKTFTLRQDFFPCDKLQTEDDITASVLVPADKLKWKNGKQNQPAQKILQNVEFRLFQRPDDAIYRGYDKITENDMARPGCFMSNWEPMEREEIQKIVDDTVGFEQFTEPMQKRLLEFLASSDPKYCVSSAHPRLVDGKPTLNPRYLQDSMEVQDPRAFYVGSMGTRLARGIPLGDQVPVPVNGILCGRRNNPPDPKNNIPALAVHNPMHFYELPELLMELTSSMTGKSPSTTGAGSEGALTKGPFNMLNMIHDLNNALVSYAISGYDVWITSAGCIGPLKKVEHDISLLVPEVWSRMREEEKSSKYLIENGYLEKMGDMEIDGKTVPAGVLGYRITEAFVKQFFGRVFSNPSSVFDEDMLKPEKQDPKIFAAGIETITVTNQRVASNYLEDGGVDMAVPPLKALLHIMAKGEYEGMTLNDPKFRAMFTRDAVVNSDWYKARLKEYQKQELARLENGLKYIEDYMANAKGDWKGEQVISDLDLTTRAENVRASIKEVKDPSYLKTIENTIGTDPSIFSHPNSNIDISLPPARTART